MKRKKRENLDNLKNFFLACELKPRSNFWSILDPFAYDVEPAFIHGSLGIISYKPESYAIVDAKDSSEPLMGYIMTISHPDTILLLDKLKGFYGEETFNYHNKKVVKAYTDVDEYHNAWCYILSEPVLDSFKIIEQVSFGMWEEDTQQQELLEKLEEEN